MKIQVQGAVRVEVSEFFRPAIVPGDDVPELQLLVGGTWRTAAKGDVFDVRSPIDGSVIARAAKASADDVEEAIAAARQARGAFRATPAAARLEICARAASILAEHADTFAGAIVADLGKTTEQAASEVKATRERLGLVREEVRKIFGEYIPGDWMDDSVGKSAVVLREPVGTVAAFGPFNYPLYLIASKIIPALAAGNTVVAKAPSEAPIPLVLFARVFEEAGLPAGVLNVITGPGSEIGDLLASHADISMISFTGSTSVGRSIAAGAGPKPMHLELGGNAAGIVLADADLDVAVEKTVLGAFKNAGQRCDAISRVLVEQGGVRGVRGAGPEGGRALDGRRPEGRDDEGRSAGEREGGDVRARARRRRRRQGGAAARRGRCPRRLSRAHRPGRRPPGRRHRLGGDLRPRAHRVARSPIWTRRSSWRTVPATGWTRPCSPPTSRAPGARPGPWSAVR